MDKENAPVLPEAKDQFIAQWGSLGSAWGINRTMAQIHALLMVTEHPLSTDAVMEELRISRGNANTNLRDLVGWGLVRSVVRKGERKEFFEAEKDVWKMFCIITRERKRREVEPAMELLENCARRTASLRDKEGKAFNRQMNALLDFVKIADGLMTKVSRSEQSQVVPAMLKLFK